MLRITFNFLVENVFQQTTSTGSLYTMTITFVPAALFVLCLNSSTVQPASIRPVSINHVDILPHSSLPVESTRKSTQPPLRDLKCPHEIVALVIRSVRGGGALVSSTNPAAAAVSNTAADFHIAAADSESPHRWMLKKAPSGLLFVMSMVAYYYYRTTSVSSEQESYKWLSLLDKEALKSTLLQLLQRVNSLGLPGMLYYSIFLMLWEGCSLPTTPIETSAGMVFGVRKAFVANFIGKNSGVKLPSA